MVSQDPPYKLYSFIAKNPMQPPGRELTDPWISKLLFIYIDPIVVLANKVSHLKVDQLPPLLDVDYSSYITKQAFAVCILSQ